VIHTECPLCDARIVLDDDRNGTACDECGVALQLALDEADALPLAA